MLLFHKITLTTYRRILTFTYAKLIVRCGHVFKSERRPEILSEPMIFSRDREQLQLIDPLT